MTTEQLQHIQQIESQIVAFKQVIDTLQHRIDQVKTVIRCEEAKMEELKYWTGHYESLTYSLEKEIKHIKAKSSESESSEPFPVIKKSNAIHANPIDWKDFPEVTLPEETSNS